MRRITVMAGSFMLLASWAAVSIAATQPTISLTETQVVATGLTPGGKLAWLGVAREREGWTTRVTQWQDANAVADSAGRAVLDLGRAVPVKSIWVVVDMTTGAFAADAPPAYPWAVETDFPTAGATFASDRASIVSLQDDKQQLEVLVVRPKVGAWRATIRHDDPGSRDSAGVLLTPSDLAPWGKAPSSPGLLVPGDVIVGIDPDGFTYFARQLGAVR
jgi:hypothetical protein